jgi:hypothetical protein
MFKIVLFSLIVLTMTGCRPSSSTSSWQSNIDDTPALKDCQAVALDNGFNSLTVVRCPNSTTTTKTSGKFPKTSVVIDGIVYEQKE